MIAYFTIYGLACLLCLMATVQAHPTERRDACLGAFWLAFLWIGQLVAYTPANPAMSLWRMTGAAVRNADLWLLEDTLVACLYAFSNAARPRLWKTLVLALFVADLALQSVDWLAHLVGGAGRVPLYSEMMDAIVLAQLALVASTGGPRIADLVSRARADSHKLSGGGCGGSAFSREEP